MVWGRSSELGWDGNDGNDGMKDEKDIERPEFEVGTQRHSVTTCGTD